METISLQQPKPVGRPTAMTPGTVQKLQAAFQRGFSVSTACKIARISRETYYKWLKDSPEFLDRMEGAQEYAKILAGDVIVDVLQDIHRGKKDEQTGQFIPKKYNETTVVNTAKWYAEKTEKEVFGSQSMLAAKLESDGKGGQTATIIYATDNQLDQLLGRTLERLGGDQDSEGQLLEVSEESTQGESVPGGSDQGRVLSVHREGIPPENPENTNLS